MVAERKPTPSDRQGFDRRWYAGDLQRVYLPPSAPELPELALNDSGQLTPDDLFGGTNSVDDSVPDDSGTDDSVPEDSAVDN